MQLEKGRRLGRSVFFGIEFFEQLLELSVDRMNRRAQTREFGAGLRFVDRKVRDLEVARGEHLRVPEGGARAHGGARKPLRLSLDRCAVLPAVLGKAAGVFVKALFHHSSSPNFD